MTVTFGGVTLNILELTVTQHPHKTKQTLGKRVTQHQIIGADSNDNVLEIGGELVSNTGAALKTLRNSLENLNDGAKHAYADSSDSRYDGDYVIETGSLQWNRKISDLFIGFSIRLVEW